MCRKSRKESSAAALEARTVSAMIRMYCHARHKPGRGLCAVCSELNDYALTRISRCAFGRGKPACERCPVHCFAPDKRAKIQKVMRYAGPRMPWRHPLLAIRHLLRSRLCPPPKPGKRS